MFTCIRAWLIHRVLPALANWALRAEVTSLRKEVARRDAQLCKALLKKNCLTTYLQGIEKHLGRSLSVN